VNSLEQTLKNRYHNHILCKQMNNLPVIASMNAFVPWQAWRAIVITHANSNFVPPIVTQLQVDGEGSHTQPNHLL
jgi:hypothetical protein